MRAVWIRVFRAGEYGAKGTYTEQDLDALVKDYDPGVHEAPVVLGHPTHDAPAYGWVKALRRTGEFLEALVQPTVQEFVDWVRRGLYKTVSIALYKKLPKTGRIYLRHLGFLGARPPEVKGLPAPAFKAEDGDFQDVEIEEAILREEAVGRVIRGCDLFKDRVWTILTDSMRPDKKAAVLEQIEQLRDLVASQEFSETATPKENGAMNKFWQDLKALFKAQGIQVPEESAPAAVNPPVIAPAPKTFTEDEVRAREDAAAKKEREGAEALHRQAAHVSETKTFLDGLKKQGKYLPAWEEMGLTAVILGLPTEATITFGEGKEKKSPAAVMRAFLEGLPKLVTLEEVAKAGKEPPAAQRDAAAMFAANEGIFHQLGVSREMLTKAADAEAAKQGKK